MQTIAADIDRVRDYIARMNGSGDGRLPAEPKLSEALGLTRGRVRTVLKRLESEGLIWRHVGKGTFVGQRKARFDASERLATVSGDDIFETRLAFEPELAACAAIRATSVDLASMDELVAEMIAAPTFLRWKGLDERLHRTIAEAARNALLLIMYDAMAQAKLALDTRMTEVFGADFEPREVSNEQHRALVDAIRAQSPTAAEHAMRTHLQSVRTRVFGQR